MDKEDFADSHASTLTTSEQVKGILGDDSSIYLDKRKIDSNIEFDELMASVSDSSDEEMSEIEKTVGIKKRSMVMNKTSVKIGKKFSDRLEEIGDYHKCANESCNAGENGERVKLVRVLFQNEASLYCEKCSHAIRQKWTCLFCSCIYTEASHSNNRDQNIWIMCEYKKCCRWTHLECEEVHRNQDLKTKLKDSKYKFHCSECLENHKNKGESPSNDTRVRPIAAMKSTSRRESLSIEENLNDKFAQCLNTESKYEIYTSSLFSYLFSESYQGVEKLIVESKRSLTLESGLNLSLSENELSKDFSQIFDKTRDKRFVVSAKNHPIPKNIACERLPGRKKQYKSVMEYKYNH